MPEQKIYKDADSRLAGFFGQVTHATLPLQRTYCFLCGKPYGYSSMESSRFVKPAQVLVTCDDRDEIMLQRAALEVPAEFLDAYGMVPEKRN
jgi:hypothetical protein